MKQKLIISLLIVSSYTMSQTIYKKVNSITGITDIELIKSGCDSVIICHPNYGNKTAWLKLNGNINNKHYNRYKLSMYDLKYILNSTLRSMDCNYTTPSIIRLDSLNYDVYIHSFGNDKAYIELKSGCMQISYSRVKGMIKSINNNSK